MLTTGMHILKHLNFNELGFGWSSLHWSNIQNIKALSIIQKTAGPWHVPFSNQMQLREIATNVCLKLYSPYTVYNSVSLALFPFKWKVIYFRVDPLEVRNDFTFHLKAPKCLVFDTSTFNFQHNTIKKTMWFNPTLKGPSRPNGRLRQSFRFLQWISVLCLWRHKQENNTEC